ncbi:hypothetical protein GOODEAATRI_016282, partial [Goodea atripinnis]
NSVVVVPGRSAAPPALLVAQLFTGAGLPAGTLNVLTGKDVTLGAKVSQNPNVSYITYSGNKQDGLALCKASAGMGVPVSVSPCVGATCPFIIFESADIDSALDEVLQIAFMKKKEVHWVLCVQESVSDSVVARLKLRMAGMKCVALSSDADRVLVDAAVQEAQQQGAMLVQPCSASPSGAQYPPTVLCGAAPSSPYVVTPPPGPLLPLLTFRSSAEAVILGSVPVSPSLLFSPSSSLLSCFFGVLKSYPQFVGGKACKSVSGCSMPVQTPGGGSVLAFCPDGGRKDVRNAVEAAIKVQPGWMKKSPSARAQSLYSLAKGLESKKKDVSASVSTQLGVSVDEADKEVELSIARLNVWAAYCDKVQGGSLVLQSSDLPAGLVNIITGNRDQLTVALANHSVIKAIWYWGRAEGCQYLQYTCTSPLKTLRLFCQKDGEGSDAGIDWAQSHPSLLEDLWRNAVQWKSVWIPTA